jgi:hypothetical protein
MGLAEHRRFGGETFRELERVSYGMRWSTSVVGIVVCSLAGCAGRLAGDDLAPPDAAVDAVAPEAGPTACPANQEICDGVCVVDGVAHCGPSCTPCVASVPLAHPTCDGTTCGVACDVLECDGICTSPDDSSNCGACGRSCAGQACLQSVCVPEVVENGPEIDFAVGGGEVDYTALLFDSSTELRRVSAGGGTPTAFAGGAGAYDVALDPIQVYWTDASSFTLWRAPLGGGTASELATQTLGMLTVAGPIVYYGGSAMVWQVPNIGGTPSLLASTIHYVGLAVDMTDVYCAGEGVVRLARSNGASTTLRPTSESEEAIALDAQNVVYARYQTTGVEIEVMPKSSPNTSSPLASVAHFFGALAVDGSYVYFGDGTALVRVPEAGGPHVTLANAKQEIRKIALDSGYVYFGDGTEILRTPE